MKIRAFFLCYNIYELKKHIKICCFRSEKIRVRIVDINANDKDWKERLSNCESGSIIKLHGKFDLKHEKTNRFFVGKHNAQNLITFNKPNLVIDGENAQINFEVESFLEENVNMLYLSKEAKNVKLKNLRISFYFKGKSSSAQVCAIYNTAYYLKLTNCKFDMFAESQINAVCIYNNGDLDTTLETRADNLVISDCYLKVQCAAQSFEKPNTVYAIYNNLANSIAIENNYIYATNSGSGVNQQAIGIYNSGRFARIENNNIKANGSHNKGKLLEHAHAYGAYNTGPYMVFTGNNCVGEWGGKCVGLYNAGECSNITANKILSTHTIFGRTVQLAAEHCILNSNIITSTSRNPHLLDVFAGDNVITGNYMQGLMGFTDYYSGCGVFVRGDEKQKIRRCNISNNIISNGRDFGIVLINTENNIVKNNQLIKFPEANDYTAVYTENSNDKIADNITDGQSNQNYQLSKERLLRNYDEAVRSIYQ